MKRYLFGALAIIIAAAVVANTSPKKAVFVDYFFAYYGPPTFAEVDVENPANWVNVSSLGNDTIPPVCNNINVKACRIKVPASKTEFDPIIGIRRLKITTVINAAQAPGSFTYYVTPTGDVIQALNKY